MEVIIPVIRAYYTKYSCNFVLVADKFPAKNPLGTIWDIEAPSMHFFSDLFSFEC